MHNARYAPNTVLTKYPLLNVDAALLALIWGYGTMWVLYCRTQGTACMAWHTEPHSVPYDITQRDAA